jgi:hypothetical protein
MKRVHQDGDAGSAITPDSPSPRRDFLKRCGRYVAVTPPMITLLLSAAGPNYALAASGRQRARSAADTNEPGDEQARPTTRLPQEQSVQPLSSRRIEPIGAGNTAVRAAGRNACHRSLF